jgi:adenosylcobinamide kinase/adenosylcobinamide-phosphate guanylyltransferase
VESLVQVVQQTPAALILVGEEAGWGVSPATAIGGLFRQRLGELQRQLAPLCDTSWLAVHGRAIEISRLGEAIPLDGR